ncbi:DUF192 domain-containing protein [bacterium]|nr:DUF192 domain-containing protein [bacterium]
MKTILKKGETVLYGNCKVANTFFSRFIGLMGKSFVADDNAIIFPRCNSIHTFFMRIPIDIIFVSESGKVVRVFSQFRPWKLLLPVKGAVHSIEVSSQGADRNGIRIGDQLTCPGVFG